MPKKRSVKPVTASPQAPHWVDKLVDEIISWQRKNSLNKLHVDDMKTPSGRVHVGSVRGVVLHDVVAKVLAQKTKQNIHSTYVFNDLDPMDGLPAYLDQSVYKPHMGEPLYKIPAPPLAKSGIDFEHESHAVAEKFATADSFAEFYAQDFINALRALGCDQEIVWSHQLYESGQMDPFIKTALDSVKTLKKIYQQVADYHLPPRWYPFQVFCPACGKLSTTLVTDWDGQEVTFACLNDQVKWAQGCGYEGKVSPFGGTGKLLWKVDWPAHWVALGVNIEGAGKDHTSAGGSRDMANAICRQVFKIASPFDIPYEWILVRGTKMSSSKGIGTSAREFVELFPPAVGRFLFISHDYRQVIDFDPQQLAIPDLYDEYDLGANIFWQKISGDQRLARSFELSQLEPMPESHFLPRFRDVVTWMQYPELDLAEKFAGIKGSPLTTVEKKVLRERQVYGQIWLDRYAPVAFNFTPQPTLPIDLSQLKSEQLAFAKAVLELVLDKTKPEPAILQQTIFDLAKASLGPKLGFAALYQVLLGKNHGPRAAWLLQSTPPQIIQNRLDSLAKASL